MTPKYSAILWWSQKNIHKIFIPPKIFKILTPKKWPEPTHVWTYQRTPPPPPLGLWVGRDGVGLGRLAMTRVGILVIVPVVAQFSSIGYLSVQCLSTSVVYPKRHPSWRMYSSVLFSSPKPGTRNNLLHQSRHINILAFILYILLITTAHIPSTTCPVFCLHQIICLGSHVYTHRSAVAQW